MRVWVMARLTEQVSGQRFWRTTENRVLEPLGIRDIVADPAGVALERVAHLADTSHPQTDVESYNSAYWRGLALPWGGLFGTPRDAVRFAAAFLPSGERFLSDAAMSLMTTDQTMGVAAVSKAPRCAGIPAAGVLAGKSKARSGVTGRGTSHLPERFVISATRERCCGATRNGIWHSRYSPIAQSPTSGVHPSPMGATEQRGGRGRRESAAG